MNDKEFSKCVDRNIKGVQLEKEGNIKAAIKLYEENISLNFEGNHPYDRLCVIYRRNKLINEEIRVLNKAIEVFTALSTVSPRADVIPKLNKFKERLSKALLIKAEELQLEKKKA